MKGTRWVLLMILISVFISAGSLTTWTGEQLQVQVKLIRTLTGHTDNVESVAFFPDGRFLASGLMTLGSSSGG